MMTRSGIAEVAAPWPGAITPVVLAGPIARLTDDGRTSAIAKTPIAGPWTIEADGIRGDAQADRENHGGLEMALHHYPFDHYAAWRADMGAHPRLEAPGGFGENLSASGWTEDNIHIGDVVRWGDVLLQVSQGRQPCWKLNVRFARKTMSREVQTTGRIGWYYRVLEPGIAHPGEVMTLIARPQPDWPLRRLIDVLYKRCDDRDALATMAELPELSDGWRGIVRKRLASRRTEDWTGRLEGRAI